VRTEGRGEEFRISESLSRNLNNSLVPKKVFLTAGVGRHKDPLMSFELALRDAGIERFNLVLVSSILPPQCEVVEFDEGIRDLNPGQIVFCVMAKETSDRVGERIYASIAIAIPEDSSLHGYIAEYHGVCNGEGDVGRKAEETASQMLETAFGIKPARTVSLTRFAEVRDCTTVVSAAVFVL